MASDHPADNPACQDPTHNEHLCYLVSQGLHISQPERYKDLVAEPAYKCWSCGRLAGEDKNLCKPVDL